jgi:C1A family cysteine protease
MGWLPDPPSVLDYTPQREEVKEQLKKVKGFKSGKGLSATAPAPAPKLATADLRAWCSPIENQGNLGSCTANAGIGLLEYFERRACGRHLDASRLFLYKATRNLLGWTGDTGAWLRTTMEAMVLFGSPPERFSPYTIATFDVEPSSFCYAFAANYRALIYYRLDPSGVTRPALLATIKNYINAGLPSMFGFTVYSSYSQASPTGKFPYPAPGEGTAGGHAVVAVGYDDNMLIKGTAANAPQTKGAFLIRNSWGTAWGDAGYGWLPYEYVLKGQAVDWWSLIKASWVDTGAFS